MTAERRTGMDEVLQRLSKAETHLVHGATKMASMDTKIDAIQASVSLLRDEVHTFGLHLKHHCEESEVRRNNIVTNGVRIAAIEGWRNKVTGALKLIASLGVLGAILEIVRRYFP